MNESPLQISPLLDNIVDQVKEIQIKLGYTQDTVRLYYVVSSLNHLLHTHARSAQELNALLLPALREPTVLGTLHAVVNEGRIEITVPPQGAHYVHTQVPTPAFLVDLVHLFQTQPHCTLSDIRRVFAAHADAYHCERMPDGAEFDYLLYFEDPSIDPYFYCLRDEMGHFIYHRFTKDDYYTLVS